EVVLDLTPYIGQVIRLGWHYELFSFDVTDNPGWMIDDISVTVTNAPIGNLTVTNNISQARFTIAGPTTNTGTGLSYSFTNAAAGQYIVTWEPVPYYTTPSPQTNNLTTNGAISFSGVYTFADVNHNGISDAWEAAFFGSVSANHPATTDTDHDGMSDYAEFFAGTDPTNAESHLEIAMPVVNSNRTIGFNWNAIPGRSYRLEGTTDATNWIVYSDWVIATSATASITLPPLAQRQSYLFRLRVQP
ncbi:MAG TPA: thrombospondin type 3 repeat-containing protein, partial [Verrucomicrobiae bacterium]|nr:thrombospondin type 3 repeat-containing protein [Verrucomicrobiae bacterium]